MQNDQLSVMATLEQEMERQSKGVYFLRGTISLKSLIETEVRYTNEKLILSTGDQSSRVHLDSIASHSIDFMEVSINNREFKVYWVFSQKHNIQCESLKLEYVKGI